MRFSTVAAALLPVGVAFAQTTHVVKVGGGGNLAYDPPSLTEVKDGDVVQFQFLDKNHTVTQSTFANPCSNITDATGVVTGVDSGYQAVAADAAQFPVWQITVNNASAPLWFYCRQAKHCQAGMVFAVNPTADKSFDAFKAAAALSTSVNGSPNGNTAAAGTNTTSTGTGSTGTTPASGTPAGGAVGTDSAGAATPSASGTGADAGANGNGAGSVRVGAAASLVTLVGLSLGLLL
ncbi:hypothetical protein C8Q74DRAFT_1229963 [Fomes fomentarius]|nr:hypothetical protein C8Q74DRAFT_1229963 [Fomes fomentarius]